MTEQDVKNILIETGAIMDGHFLLTSGLHSPHYVEKFNVLQHPKYTEQLCRAMAEKFVDDGDQAARHSRIGAVLQPSDIIQRLRKGTGAAPNII